MASGLVNFRHSTLLHGLQLPARYPVLVLLVVTLLVVGAAATGSSVIGQLSYKSGDFTDQGSESFKAEHELETTLPKKGWGIPDISVIARGGPGSAGVAVKRSLRQLPEVAKVEDYVFSSRDGRWSNVLAWLHRDAPASAATDVAKAIDRPGVEVGGSAIAKEEFAKRLKEDISRAEVIALPLLFLLALFVYRNLIAAFLPVAIGGCALAFTLGGMRILNEFVPLSIFSLNIALALALGLGVDYSLLAVSRFREELTSQTSPRAAALRTVRTAGRTVALSSCAVATSFTSLLILPIPLARSLAVGGMMASLFTGCAALMALPALFSLLGRRITRTDLRLFRRPTGARSDLGNGIWFRLGKIVMARPKVVALLSSLLLLGLALPASGMRLTAIGVTSLPPSADARIFASHLRSQFEHPILGEISVAIHGREPAAKRVFTRLEDLDRRSKEAALFPLRLKHSSRLWQANINPAGPVFSEESEQLVTRLRSMNAPIAVGGETASFIDTLDSIDRHLPLAVAVLALSSFCFVFLATGSLVLPVKALIMNLLALGAALGVVVLLFQDGLLQGPLDFRSEGALAMTPPIVIVAGSFGLLTDYGLFLLMRIKEQREAGSGDEEAVIVGLQRTGRVITAAAILLCVAVGAFGTSQVVFIKASAVGMVTAVLLDAFVVRLLLVPSLMVILGRWNWWPRKMRSAPAAFHSSEGEGSGPP